MSDDTTKVTFLRTKIACMSDDTTKVTFLRTKIKFKSGIAYMYWSIVSRDS